MASKTFVSVKDAKYQLLLDIMRKIAPEKPYLVLQSEVTSLWKDELEGGTNPRLFEQKMIELRKKLANKKGGIMAFMARAKDKSGMDTGEEKEKVKEDDVEVVEDVEVIEELNDVMEKEWTIDNRKETKVQDGLKNRISVLEKKTLLLIEERSIGSSEGKAKILTEEIKNTRKELEAAKKELKHKADVQKAVQKHRQKKKEFEDNLKVENPELAKALKLRDAPGRPTIEEDNPGNGLF